MREGFYRLNYAPIRHGTPSPFTLQYSLPVRICLQCILLKHFESHAPWSPFVYHLMKLQPNRNPHTSSSAKPIPAIRSNRTSLAENYGASARNRILASSVPRTSAATTTTGALKLEPGEGLEPPWVSQSLTMRLPSPLGQPGNEIGAPAPI